MTGYRPPRHRPDDVPAAGFTTDDIALLIEIPEIYDGAAAYLLRDGRLVNRFAGKSGWGNLVGSQFPTWREAFDFADREARR